MNEKTLKELLESENLNHDLRLRDIYRRYAISNNPYKVGDIITDHIGTIKVEAIGIYVSYLDRSSSCTYSGVELKKDLTPKKSGAIRKVFQCNVIKKEN